MFYAETREVPADNPFHSREEAGEWLKQELGTWTAVHREALRLGRYQEAYDLAWSLHRNIPGGELEHHRWDEVFDIGLRAARALGDRAAEANMLGVLGWSLSMTTGDDEGAVAMLRAASELTQEIGDSATFVMAHASLGFLLTRLGRTQEALEHAELIRRLSRGHDFFQTRLWAMMAVSGTLARRAASRRRWR